ncbi:MAG: hypothetical protein HUU17_03965 [Chthonomonadales bacterium]|nr:hypothetical protein [Chthonomonadales bacterium]
MMIRNIAAVVGLAVLSISVQAQYTSTFDSNNESWRFATMASPFNSGSGPAYPGTTVVGAPFLGGLGNPPGSIGVTSDIGDYQYFLTPLAWNGNRSSLMNGSITWDYYYTTTAPWNNAWGDIAIRDTLNNRWIVADVTAVSPTAGVWNTFSVNLDPSTAWKIGSTAGALATNGQILAALTNMGGVYFRGEVVAGMVETYRLDNVHWKGPVIPEAGTMASFGSFLATGLFWLRRRIKA